MNGKKSLKLIRRNHIFIDTSHRNSGSINDFRIILNPFWTQVNQNQQLKIALTDATIPYNFNNINSTNKTVIIGGTTYNLEEGNYSTFDLANSLQTFISIEDSNASITYSAITNKFTIRTTTVGTTTFVFSTSFKVFGFADGSTTYNLSSVSNVVSTGLANVLLYNDLYIRTNLNTNNILDNQISTILCKVPIDVAPFSNIVYSNHSVDNQITFNQKSINFLHVRLTDIDDNLIPMVDNYSFILTIELFEEIDIQDPLEEVVKLLQDLILQRDIIEKKKKVRKNKLL
tara:strand:- start:2133 stop:2993 length:861 start_codon:yes stop_codon:yes gene_type:complete